METSNEAEPSDEEMRKLLKPAPTTEQVLDAIQKSYVGDEGPTTVKLVRELESYDDRNYWVEISGTPYLVKVHNGVESKDFIRLWKEESAHERSVIHLQNALMEHLCSHGISTSKPVKPDPKTNPGSALPTAATIHALPVVSEKHSPCDLVVRLLHWVPGSTMESKKLLPLETLVDVGRFLGNLSNKLNLLDADTLPASKRYHQWDGRNTSDLKTFTQYIKDDGKRAMVESILNAFQEEIIGSGVSESFEKALIHGDFNDANVLVDDDFMISGVLDFGDSVESWRVLDLTIAMAYSMLSVYGKKNRSISAAAAVLRGYNDVNPITEAERRHLILLVACRLACSVTLGAYSYQQNPGNEYLLIHAVPAWNCLELIWGRDPDKRKELADAINGIFDRACTSPFQESSGKDSNILYCSDLSFPDPALVDPLATVRASGDEQNGNGPPTKKQKSR